MPTVEMAEADGNLLTNNELRLMGLSCPAPADTNFRAKAICTEEILYGADLCTWRTKRGNNLALIVAKILCATTGQVVPLSYPRAVETVGSPSPPCCPLVAGE